MSDSESESEVYVYSSDGSDFDGFTEAETRKVATDRAACHSGFSDSDFVGDLESSESSDSDSSTDEVITIELYSNMCKLIIVIHINL